MKNNQTINKTDFTFENQLKFYRGKVRDVYTLKNDKLIIITTDRISTFDVVLPITIPYKGQVLNQMAQYGLNNTKDICPNWLEAAPDPNVSIGINCKPFPVEMVIRGYLAGHAWREYKSGKREICGVSLPNGLNENDKLPNPIITPTIKATKGQHDEDISKKEILKSNLVSEKDYEIIEKYTHALYQRGVIMAKKQGLILVDTKYEFGKFNNDIYLIDEIHTPDSSRYFYLYGYNERQKNGEPQKQLSKEFVRQWLIQNGFQGLKNQKIPTINKDIIEEISNRYIHLYSQTTGLDFKKRQSSNLINKIEDKINEFLNKNR